MKGQEKGLGECCRSATCRARSAVGLATYRARSAVGWQHTGLGVL